MNTPRSCILFSFLLLISCSSIKDTSLPSEVKPIDKSSYLSSPSEVSGCKVKATILSIDSLLHPQDPGSPCSKKPCVANIRIDEIIKMGQMCGTMIYKGAVFKVYFAFTLAETTKELFPNLIAHYPGLEKNDTFVSSIEARSVKENNEYQTIVYAYEKIE